MAHNDVVRKRVISLGMLLTALIAGLLLLAGCKNVRSPEVVKIGLIAPFEGPSRPLGYDVLNAVKLRINQWNESGAPYKIELVALNDDSDPDLAVQLPAQLAQDPDIRLILGPPQGHTAMAALPALAKTGLPVVLLAPVSEAHISSMNILPYAGLGRDYTELFSARLGKRVPAAWRPPVSEPVIWLGDPLTLAETYSEHPQRIVATGPVAEEEALHGWAPDLSVRVPWAAPAPITLPADFPSAYQALAGKAPGRAASLAHAATDHALGLISSTPNHQPDGDAVHIIPTPPILVINP